MSRIELIDNPPMVDWMLNGVELESGVAPARIGVAHDEQGKSLNLLGQEVGGQIELIGWHAPMIDDEQLPRESPNTTHLADLPQDLQNIEVVGKGVGARLYNTRSAALGALTGGRQFGLYAAQIDPTSLLDTRQGSEAHIGGKLMRIAQHVAKIAALRTGRSSLEEIVDKVHGGYGDADAVVWNQPPRALIRQYNGGGREQVVPPTFAIIRAPGLLRRAGVLIDSWSFTLRGWALLRGSAGPLAAGRALHDSSQARQS